MKNIKQFKFNVLKKWKKFLNLISPLHSKTVINDTLEKSSNMIVYASFNFKDESLKFHKIHCNSFKQIFPNYSKINIYLTEILQNITTILKFINFKQKSFIIKADDLYISNLKVKKFHNNMGDVLDEIEKANLLIYMSKHLLYKDWIKFIINWGIYEKKYQLIDILLDKINNIEHMSNQMSFSSKQMKNFNELFKDVSESFWTPYLEPNPATIYKNVDIFNKWIYLLANSIVKNSKSPTFEKQLSEILFKFWETDQKLNDYFYIIRHFNNVNYFPTIKLLDELIDKNILKIPLDKDFNSKEKHFKYSPYFYSFNDIDDYVPYYNVKIDVLLHYCSRSIAFQYFNNLNNAKKNFHKYIEKLFKLKYKHNINLYDDKTGNTFIEVLGIYEDELNFLLDFLTHNPEYMMVAFEPKKQQLIKASEIAKIFDLQVGMYQDDKTNIADEINNEFQVFKE